MCKGIPVPPYTYPHSGPSHSSPSLPPGACGMSPGRFRPRDFEMPCYPLWVHLSWFLFALPPPLHTLGSACLAQPQNKLFCR